MHAWTLALMDHYGDPDYLESAEHKRLTRAVAEAQHKMDLALRIELQAQEDLGPGYLEATVQLE